MVVVVVSFELSWFFAEWYDCMVSFELPLVSWFGNVDILGRHKDEEFE